MRDAHSQMGSNALNQNIEVWVHARRFSPFSLKRKILVAIWWFVQGTLFRMSLHPMHGWRRGLLRLFGAEMSLGSSVHATAKIWFPGNLVMGKHSGIGFDAVVYNLDKVTIGDHVSIAHRVHLNTGSHDYRDPEFGLLTKPISIGSGVFVGTDAYVGPGVTIGAMTVIGARSVVTSDMPAEMVCYGHPCRPVKRREKANQ
jgi:putative colanic acid biosynthesis acetyltransferase WcaF